MKKRDMQLASRYKHCIEDLCYRLRLADYLLYFDHGYVLMIVDFPL